MKVIITIFGCIFITNASMHLPRKFDTNNQILSNTEEKKNTYTLPNTAIPKKYTLIITPYLDETSDKKFTFDGVVEIEVQIVQNVRDIILHSKDLSFKRNSVTIKGEKNEIQEFSITFDTNRDFVNITNLKGTFDEGVYTLTINYVGILNDDMHGFYRSSYVNENGEKTWLAATHFEPVSARRSFPCFDEPQYKASFNVTIIHNKKYSAISNMRVNSVTSTKDLTITTFYTSPLMSTYLLAFVVSDFKKITNENTNFTVFARPNAIKHGNLALSMGEKILKLLEEFTGISFKIGKMDQAAIPDFAAGAMENWGLVLYREKSLLYDNKTLTTSEKQNIVETIAHEFAHQWFGDLVSPKWWKYVWLNEGFANFFESYITERVEPEYHSIDQSVVKGIQTKAFDFDSGSTTHPLNQDVETPNEINAIFDSISYQKGGAVIRMMQHFLTEPIFQKSLKNYLHKKSLTAANSDDLLTAMQEIVDSEKLSLDLKTIMDKWINFKGYPVVHASRNYKNSILELKQERFFAYNASQDEKNNKYEWYIPINYATRANTDFNKTTPQEWLKSAALNISLDIDSKDWLIVNKQQTGFYRVNYDDENWKLIINYLKSENRSKIHILNRAQLMDDALAFMKEEKLDLQILLHLTSYLKNESDYIAWYPGFKTFTWLNTKLINTEYYTTFKDYVLSTIEHLLDSVGLEESENDKHLTKLNRIKAIDWACLLNHSGCINKMQEKLLSWLDNSEKNVISVDLKQLTLCHGLKLATVDTWKKVLDKYMKTNDTDEKKYYLTSLGCSNNKDILREYFDYIVNDNSPFNNTFSVITTAINSAVEHSEAGIDVALDFVIQRFISLLRKIKNEDYIARLFGNIGNKITTINQLEKLKATKKMDIPNSITRQGIELAENNIKWLKSNEKILNSWTKEINSHGKSGTIRITSTYLSIILLALLIFI